MLRMAIVGVGWAGSRQAEAAGELGRKLEISCLVDPDPEHLAARAEELAVDRTSTRLDEVLADDGIDAVSICSPHRHHCEQAVAAAQAGKHVLVEKPMAMDVDESTRMIDAAARAGVRLYVAESASYHPMARFVRRTVETGEHVGALTSASVARGFRAPVYGYPGRRAWLSEPAQGGLGTWMLHGIHTMAQLRYALGEVRTVYLREHKAASFARRDLEGTMCGLLTLESGVPVHVLQTAETRLYADLGGYVLHGDQGSVRAGEECAWLFTDAADGEQVRYPQQPLSAYAQELEAFADYVTDGVEGPTTGVAERRSLAIVQAGYESAASGRPVDLEERFGSL